jgi:hypothetical protein
MIMFAFTPGNIQDLNLRQSAVYFLFLFALQFLFSLFSSVMVWLMFVFECLSVIFLGYHAYVNADTLVRYKIPVIGKVLD